MKADRRKTHHLLALLTASTVALATPVEAHREDAPDPRALAQTPSPSAVRIAPLPHDLRFLARAATMRGRSAEALAAARKAASCVPRERRGDDGAIYQSFLALPLDVMLRFGLWEEILAEPRPPEDARFWSGVSHFARGMAYANTRRIGRARGEQAALERIADDPIVPKAAVEVRDAARVLTIARHLLAGELALWDGEVDSALAHFERAVRFEDGLPYGEPPVSLTPSRHYLGAALLRAARPREAETVYRQDLAANRENGFSLFGLAQALEAQERRDEAWSVRRRFAKAWKSADVVLRFRRRSRGIGWAPVPRRRLRAEEPGDGGGRVPRLQASAHPAMRVDGRSDPAGVGVLPQMEANRRLTRVSHDTPRDGGNPGRGVGRSSAANQLRMPSARNRSISACE